MRQGKMFAAVIDKRKLASSDANRWSPYDIALGMCLEKCASFLVSKGQSGQRLHVIFEARGKKEDTILELEFRRAASGSAKVGYGLEDVQKFSWTPLFLDKRSNSTGLQIADLAARPIGLSYLRPKQRNRAFDAMKLGLLQGSVFEFP